MIFALTHGLSLLLLLMLFYATGALIAAAGRIPAPPALGRFLTHTTLGLIAWMYGSFALACVGLYRNTVFLPLAACLLVGALYRALRRSDWRSLLKSGRWARGAGLGLLFLAPAALVLLAAFINALSPELGWDDDVYHLTLPKRYLQHGGFQSIPFSVYSHWPHAIELIYGLALGLADQVLGKLVHTLFLALVLLAVYRLCRQRTSRLLAAAATLLVLGNGVVLFEAPIAYIDIGFALFFLIAVACADEYLRSEETIYLALAGVCAGTVAGSKLSGLVVPLIVAAMVWLAQPLRFDRKRIARIVLAIGVPSVLLVLPWYVKSYLDTGNPFYPFLFPQLGGIEWSAELGRDFSRWQRSLGMGRSLHDYLALPYRVVVSGERGYGRFDASFGKFWLAAAPLAMLGAYVDRSVRSYVLCAGFYFIVWALSSQQGRFLIAVLPLLAIAAALTADSAIGKLRLPAMRTGLRVALALAVGLTALPVLGPFCQDAAVRSGRLWRDGSEDLSAAVPEGYAFLNTHSRADAKIMLLNVNKGFFLERDYIADSFFEASQMNWLLRQAQGEEELGAMLARLGITHIYLDHKNWNIAYPPWVVSFLSNPARVERDYTCRNGTCTIYRLRTHEQTE